MDGTYTAILDGVIAYEQKSQAIVCFFLMVAIAVMLFFAIKDFRKDTRVNRVILCILPVVFACILILFVWFQKQTIARLEADARNEAYIVYSGQLTHDNYQKDSFYHNVSIAGEGGEEMILRYPDYGNQYHLHDGQEILPTGTFTGTIVYSKTSKIIVDWTLDEAGSHLTEEDGE